MRYVVRPGLAVGALRFDMSRADVVARLGPPDGPEPGEAGGGDDAEDRAGDPAMDAETEVEDEWEDDGLAVRYDAQGRVVEIALFPPACASVGGVRLLGENDGDPLVALAAADPECTEDEGVIVSGALGLLYAEDDDGTPELVVLAPGRLEALARDAADDR
mgnify:FL=1